MNILLLGTDNSITRTIRDMLKSVNSWVINLITDLTTDRHIEIQINDRNTVYDIVVANLDGLPESPKTIVDEIANQFPKIPILILYSYSHEFLIDPLLDAGANGYLQVGASETKLFEAVQKVSDGQQHVFTETT